VSHLLKSAGRGPQDKAGAVLTPDRYAAIEVHHWQFGGRR